ncbi:MAG: Uma2 family endonuclease [Chloroflexota bacterium]
MTVQTAKPVKTDILQEVTPTVLPNPRNNKTKKIHPIPSLPSGNGNGNGSKRYSGIRAKSPSDWQGKPIAKPNTSASTINEADINYDDIITEDDEPVDNFPSEKQQRLLVQPLFDNDYLPEPFIAAVDIGIFSADEDPIVPDMFLSLGVGLAKEIWKKQNRSYFVPKFGKPPEIAVEIVSNKKGRETAEKLQTYVELGIKYYVIFDFEKQTQDAILIVYELQEGRYVARPDYQLPDVGLALTFWDGLFERFDHKWLRWCNLNGDMLPTGKEVSIVEQHRAEQERVRAGQERVRAEQERVRAEQAETREEQKDLEIERLRAQLQALGIDTDAL